jgi:hypothetical protein
MKEYILLIRVPVGYGPEQAQQVNPRWEAVLEHWKKEGVFVTSFVFPTDSHVISSPDRMSKKEMVVADNLKVVSTIVIQASDTESALEWAKMAPVVDYGGTVEVRVIQPRRTSAEV